MRSRHVLGAALVAVLALGFPASLPAQSAEPAGLELVAQPPITTLRTDFTYTVRTPAAPTGAALRTTLYERLTTRSAFDRITDQRGLGATVSRVTTPLTPGSSSQSIVLPLNGSPTEGTSLNATQAGVYPVRVELLTDNAPTGVEFVTYLITVPDGDAAVREPLIAAPIVPVAAAPAFRADGTPEPATLDALTSAGRLGRLADGLARNRSTPLTVLPTGETVESWARLARENPDIAATLDRLRLGTADAARVPAPFVAINAPGLRQAGLEPTVAEELRAGTDATIAALEQAVDARTAAPGAVDEGTLELLGSRGVDQLILDPASLRPFSARLTPARPFLIEGPNRQFRSVALDAGIGRAAQIDGNGPIATAQRVLAGLALVALEAPNVSRGIAFALPTELDAPATYYDALLGGLRNNPYVRSATVPQLLDAVPIDSTTAGPLVRSLAPPELVTPSVTPGQVERSRQRAAALGTLLAPDDPRLIQARNAPLIAATSRWVGPEGERRAADELTAVEASLDEAAALILAPANRTFQLTGDRNRIPLTFVNESDQTIAVKLRFSGSRISFPDGDEQIVTLPARKSTTIQVRVEPRTSGRYPFLLTVNTTTGDVQLARSTLRVNASIVNNVGLYIAIGAGLFLAVWWGRYVWKRRRRTPQPPAPVVATDPVERSA